MHPIQNALSKLKVRTAVLLLMGMVVGMGLVRAAAWSESAEFCGWCHVMAPELRAHAASAHAQVDCGACHIAPGVLGFLSGKLANLREAWAYLTGHYTLPITTPAETLPDASLTCARCHPLNDGDAAPRLVTVPRYLSDAANTQLNVYYTLDPDRVHWHVTHPVTYLSADAEQQVIPWATDGTRVYSSTATLPPGELLRMDCTTCHNRVGHPFHTPEALLDAAFAQGMLSPQVPYLRREALKVLSAPYPNTEAAVAALQAFPETYRAAYPNLYPSYTAELNQAAQVLPELYSLSFFPELGISGTHYADNSGHTATPGCYRCHDGKHLAADGSRITRNCTACHGVPLLQAATDPVPGAPFLPPPQPASHQASDWINTHGQLKDESCAHCHAPTFCTNALCHAP